MSKNRNELSKESLAKGAHFCLIYKDETERRKVVSKFLESGFLNNEQINYFADTMKSEELISWLKEIGIEFPKNNQFLLYPTLSTYCPHGKFIPEEMIQHLCECQEQAAAQGFSKARITGETNWLNKNIPGTNRFIEYEAMINTIFDEHPCMVFCQYEANKFNGGFLFDILQVHPYMIVNGQIVKNPAYITPKEFLKAYHPV